MILFVIGAVLVLVRVGVVGPNRREVKVGSVVADRFQSGCLGIVKSLVQNVVAFGI